MGGWGLGDFVPQFQLSLGGKYDMIALKYEHDFLLWDPVDDGK